MKLIYIYGDLLLFSLVIDGLVIPLTYHEGAHVWIRRYGSLDGMGSFLKNRFCWVNLVLLTYASVHCCGLKLITRCLLFFIRIAVFFSYIIFRSSKRKIWNKLDCTAKNFRCFLRLERLTTHNDQTKMNRVFHERKNMICIYSSDLKWCISLICI